MLPFEVSKKIALHNNQYILQVKVTNNSQNKIFCDNFQFISSNSQIYKLRDLNDGLFDKSVIFNTDEIRSFIYILSPKDPLYKINKFQTEILG